GSELSDEELLKLISKEIKKIEEAAETFREGGSEQRALEELEEAEILKEYLPEPLSPQELEKIVSEAIEEIGATSIKDMGKVMKVILPRVAGRADGKIVSEIVKSRLS
ncbi:MAG: GatB/YqeY domain-containing protein, partial [Actinobacteria bacterium]|nr:GatB/YqeY domain-containing protein [Actinomycetota bacterium]